MVESKQIDLQKEKEDEFLCFLKNHYIDKMAFLTGNKEYCFILNVEMTELRYERLYHFLILFKNGIYEAVGSSKDDLVEITKNLKVIESKKQGSSGGDLSK